jgi:hypothetical protein
MKKLFMLLFAVLSLAAGVKAQTYAFVYAYNSTDKTLYISSPVNIANYSDCADNNGYNSKIQPEKCIEREFVKSVKIQAGAGYSNCNFIVRACKYENYGYNCTDPFTSESQAASAIRDVISTYRAQGYTYYKLSLN